MTSCYYPGCEKIANTKEHIPPKSFFPSDKKLNLMTVKSCEDHNNSKTKDDIYALTQICLCCLTSDEEQNINKVFSKSVIEQLQHNNKALQRTIFKNSKFSARGVSVPVDTERMDNFLNCLTLGVLFKKTGKKINLNKYVINNVYLDFNNENSLPKKTNDFFFNQFKSYFEDNSAYELLKCSIKVKKGFSEEIYKVNIMGVDFISISENSSFKSNITINHLFFGKFRVTTLLTKNYFNNECNVDTKEENLSD
ncbi:hypothetical protein AB204_06040 [Xenorhabdus khoisanae]|uniref:HNH endonuclease n=1 Tax=Xenorhabdus khoisanae TaxID=880157 RepID=A0A0J5FVK7_9GAMM|nr:hypothetical protein [Xenorhabdus khoisanae]KMJ45967.1 hypothetical protein AB204_06040 [Xenorhabdus khoisanae]